MALKQPSFDLNPIVCRRLLIISLDAAIRHNECLGMLGLHQRAFAPTSFLRSLTMKLILFALIACSLMGCEAKKVAVPGATVVNVTPK